MTQQQQQQQQRYNNTNLEQTFLSSIAQMYNGRPYFPPRFGTVWLFLWNSFSDSQDKSRQENTLFNI